MSLNPSTTLFESENHYKEIVYDEFDKLRTKTANSVKNAQLDVYRESYEDQEAFMIHGALHDAKKKRHETEALIQKLYKKPYFAHIEAKEEDTESSEHYYLSDCETLNQVVYIGNDGILIPFKQDKERPISRALFHSYQTKKGDPIVYYAPDGKQRLIPMMICDDVIDNRQLLDAVQLFPKSDIFHITADELLEIKLQENRNNPALRNIIATLQRMQFEIIEADAKQSFVVQGCAGSGKSQCLIHRLFFLRDTLSEDGWNHVLLLTPTQLFRKYSAELVRRYQLSDVEDCSIAQLYRKLLNCYDARFKNRQYQYELTEEYLPDEYLKEVYRYDVILQLETEISKAIRNYVQAGCAALGISLPTNITIVQIKELVDQLDLAMEEFDARETELQNDALYSEKREKFEALQKNLDSLQKRKERLQIEYARIIEESQEVINLQRTLYEAEQEREEWLKQREFEKKEAIKKLMELESRWNIGNDIQMPARYAQQLSIVEDILWGERHNANKEYTDFLNEYCEQAFNDLQKVVKNKSLEEMELIHDKRKRNITKTVENLDVEIAAIEAEAERYSEWLRKQSPSKENGGSNRTIRRTEMERARYFLSRIESSVFEREVWNALAPIKEKYHIQTIQIDNAKGGHQKESRILYKSDLLFYLKIYSLLYPEAELPDYRLICIDEGQDLHKADYDMLHQLYPKAAFNVFGDTAQVLHKACGIHEWRSESGIEKMYFLNKNYRNTAAIVEFCNQKFTSCSMEYIGKVKREQKPHVIHDRNQLKQTIRGDDVVLIVRDRNALAKLCASIGKSVKDFEYVDTKAESLNQNKIPCYSIFAAKGLEFRKAVVYPLNMSENQKIVACTRAMEELYYYE